jgi:pimeloyl-ACP methyl ester carboxylesterase
VPGHGFSDRPAQSGFNDYHVAKLWIKLMATLGYQRFAAHAHDLGASITGLLCLHHPEYVIGYHTTNPDNPGPVIAPDAPDLTDAERAYLAAKRQWVHNESGYAQIQRTRPQTLAYGLNDSPAGLAAWILEKWHVWTKQPGENGALPFTQDELLANVMIYWVTQTINSANRYYHDDEDIPFPQPGDRIHVPLGVALTTQPHERPPREFVERLYPDIRHWVDLPRGGHFVALEEPQLVAESIRAFFRPLR